MSLEYILIPLIALGASLLTFFSGFGLGTMLTPCFAIFFPLEIAIALTAIVHFLNNIFKIIIVRRNINYTIALPFALFSIIGAYIGAKALLYITQYNAVLHSYTIAEKQFEITALKLIIGFIILAFTLADIIPAKSSSRSINNTSKKMYTLLGGITSGFFGGLSGNQGALRSMFLIQYHIEKTAYVATGTFIACCIDFTRLSVYFKTQHAKHVKENATLIFVTVAFAFIGVLLGNKLLKKTSIYFIRNLVSFLLITISVLLIVGIL